MSQLAIFPTLPIFANVENNSIEGYLKNLDLTMIVVGDITGQPGIDLTITGDDASVIIEVDNTTNATAPPICINGGDGDLFGSDIKIDGGNGTNPGGSGGGNIFINGGEGASVGGNIDIIAGDTTIGGTAGSVTIRSGMSALNNGNITINSANDLNVTASDDITISAISGQFRLQSVSVTDPIIIDAISNIIIQYGLGGFELQPKITICPPFTNLAGDPVTLTGSVGCGTGDGGNMVLNGGLADGSGIGGKVIITGGESNFGDGGNVEIYSGVGGTGGDILLDSNNNIDITASDELALRSTLGRVLVSSFTPVDIISFQGVNTSTNAFQLHKFNTTYIIENFGTGDDYININTGTNNITIGNAVDINTITLQTSTSTFSFEEIDLGAVTLTTNASATSIMVGVKLSRYGNIVSLLFYDVGVSSAAVNGATDNNLSSVAVIPVTYRPASSIELGTDITMFRLSASADFPVFVQVTSTGIISLTNRDEVTPFAAGTISPTVGRTSTMVYSIQ